MYFPLENIESKTVGYRIHHLDGTNYIEPTALCSGVLVAKSLRSKDSAVLVSSIQDLFVLLNAGITTNIVCLPNGLINLPHQILPNLEKYNKLILWFGSDASSWDSARHFSRKLEEKRCLFVRYFHYLYFWHVGIVPFFW